jgi:uncharacterized membrane protein YcaP (DUF421 family)
VDQLTPFDLLIIFALGYAMGDPMFYPEVSLLRVTPKAGIRHLA